MQGITTLAHVAIKVSDIEKSLAFYRDGLDFPEMFRLHQNDKLWIVYLKVTETDFLELFPDATEDHAPAFGANGLDHFCFQVDDVAAVAKRIADNGIEVYHWIHTEQGPQLVAGLDGAVVLGADGNKQVWILDPDGNRVELIEMLPGNLQEQALARLRRAT